MNMQREPCVDFVAKGSEISYTVTDIFIRKTEHDALVNLVCIFQQEIEIGYITVIIIINFWEINVLDRWKFNHKNTVTVSVYDQQQVMSMKLGYGRPSNYLGVCDIRVIGET